MPPLVVIGNLSRDVVDGGPPRPGGGPYYASAALRLTRHPARIATKCAPEDRALLRKLVAFGIPVSWRPAGATAAFSFSYNGGERRMTVDAVGEPWAPREASAEAAGAKWVHVAALARSDFPAATLAALSRGSRVSLDGQGLVRPARTGPLELDADYDPETVRHVHVLKLAEEEAAVVGDVAVLGVPEVVVTLGERGSLVRWRGRSERVPAHPVPHVRDPTGAGDAFAALYLSSRAAGYQPVPAARRASRLVATLLR